MTEINIQRNPKDTVSIDNLILGDFFIWEGQAYIKLRNMPACAQFEVFAIESRLFSQINHHTPVEHLIKVDIKREP